MLHFFIGLETVVLFPAPLVRAWGAVPPGSKLNLLPNLLELEPPPTRFQVGLAAAPEAGFFGSLLPSQVGVEWVEPQIDVFLVSHTETVPEVTLTGFEPVYPT